MAEKKITNAVAVIAWTGLFCMVMGAFVLHTGLGFIALGMLLFLCGAALYL